MSRKELALIITGAIVLAWSWAMVVIWFIGPIAVENS